MTTTSKKGWAFLAAFAVLVGYVLGDPTLGNEALGLLRVTDGLKTLALATLQFAFDLVTGAAS